MNEPSFIEFREVISLTERKRYVRSAFWAIALGVLILDTTTALSGAAEGIDLCIRVLIPSLFPFFIISNMLTASLSGMESTFLRPIKRLLRLPPGGEGVFLVGLLGGYPVGAATVAQAVRNEELSKEDGRRYMAFCSNAGPSFIFGIGSQIFTDIKYCWLVWGIHILSAVTVGLLTPGKSANRIVRTEHEQTLPKALKQSLIVMASVCGWVVLFRILIAFLKRWILWALPPEVEVLLEGFLELANGAYGLPQVGNTGLKVILFSGMLSFGGVCVWMQTRSVAEGADSTLYLPGKLTQSCISILLATLAQFFGDDRQRYIPHVSVLIFCIAVCAMYPIILRKSEKKSGNSLLLSV